MTESIQSSFNPGPGAGANLPSRTRSESAADRRAESDWMPADRVPPTALWATVRSSHENSAPLKRILFNGRYWMTREAFSAWKPCPPDEKPVSVLLEAAAGVSVLDGLEVLELEPIDANDEALSLAELARLELKVDVVRLYRPKDEATGAMSGRILAASRSYAAQAIGDNAVVIHEQSKLGRRLSPGEQVTLNYQGGRAEVYNGVVFDVNISAPFLDRDQIGWLRMQMIEALSGAEGADKDDEMIRQALLYGLDRTSEMFGLEKTNLAKANIRLSVSDVITPLQLDAADAADQAVEDLKLASTQRLRGG